MANADGSVVIVIVDAVSHGVIHHFLRLGRVDLPILQHRQAHGAKAQHGKLRSLEITIDHVAILPILYQYKRIACSDYITLPRSCANILWIICPPRSDAKVPAPRKTAGPGEERKEIIWYAAFCPFPNNSRRVNNRVTSKKNGR